MAFKTTTIFQFWSSNSAQLSSRPTSCKLVTVFIIMFFTCVVRLTRMFHVWVPRRRLYDSSALHIVGGIIHISLLSSGLSPGETPSETKPSAVLCCNRHISLDSFRHALHTKENFHQSTSVASYWQKTDIIHVNTKAWLWVNGPWFLFSSSQALQTSWEFLFPFLIRVHCSSTIKTKWNERVYFFITNSTCMHIFCVT